MAAANSRRTVQPLSDACACAPVSVQDLGFSLTCRRVDASEVCCCQMTPNPKEKVAMWCRGAWLASDDDGVGTPSAAPQSSLLHASSRAAALPATSIFRSLPDQSGGGVSTCVFLLLIFFWAENPFRKSGRKSGRESGRELVRRPAARAARPGRR
jgi:hypothetical protein